MTDKPAWTPGPWTVNDGFARSRSRRTAMTRAITLSYEDAVTIARIIEEHVRTSWLETYEQAALGRFADTLDEAEAPEPSGLFPPAVIIGPSGIEYPMRSTAEDAREA
jgi:hypothetical protein